MEFIAKQKHIVQSPRKIRPVAEVIRKMTPEKALEKLPFVKREGAEMLLKVIKSAVSNASQKGVDIKNLVFKEIQVLEGPRLRRGMPVSRGRWHAIKKRMSHISITLMTKKENAKKQNAKSEQTEVKVVKTVKKVRKVVKKNGTKN